MKWANRVERAEKNKEFTEEDKELAVLWTTAPFSEFAQNVECRDGKLERGPTNLYLILDSIFFTKGVEDDNIGLAVNCFRHMQNVRYDLENGKDVLKELVELCGG